MRLTRRQAMAAAASAPLAPALVPLAATAQSAQEAGPNRHRRFQIGEMGVSALLAGSRRVENPHETFGLNASEEEFAEVSEAHFIPADWAQFYFTPTLVESGGELILFDTGLDPAGIAEALSAGGHTPEDITQVVITHMHPDHIGGLIGEDGAETFSNAAYHTGRVEFDFWAGEANEGFEAKVRPLADKIRFLEDGEEAVPGITAMAAFGHTPGHMAYHLESGGQRLILMADTANHYVWSLGYPDWEVRFDRDKAMAAETRRKLLGMAATDIVPILGYHMPFPAAGHVETDGEGFRWIPVSYQLG